MRKKKKKKKKKRKKILNSKNDFNFEDRGINTDDLPAEELQRLVDENPELKEEEKNIQN